MNGRKSRTVFPAIIIFIKLYLRPRMAQIAQCIFRQQKEPHEKMGFL